MSVTLPTHRGPARSRPRAHARALIALLTALVAVAATLPASPVPVAAAESPSFVVLVDGLCSELPVGADITASFTGANGLADRLHAAGWPADSVVAFSYHGGTVDGSGRWRPDPYACTDSRDNDLAADAQRLEVQLAAMAAAHPAAVFHVVGFSQGGVVAFGLLARLAALDGWALPSGARVGSVTTLDSPLAGVPFVNILCSVSPDTCGGETAKTSSSLADLGAIWNTGSTHPAAAGRSIATRLDLGSATNQALATAAAAHGISVFTVGNVRDWLYAPAGPDAGTLNFLDTQWLTTDPRAAGVHARAIDAGPTSCGSVGANLASSFGCNHGLVTRDAAVASAIVGLLHGIAPPLAKTCSAGKGDCLALPPRPSVAITSRIAPNVVRGGGPFGTSAVRVKSGGRATLLFTTSPRLAGKRLEIWGRSRRGVYRLMTTRTADSRGVVRYYTPPITGWAAIQARYAGDYVNGPGVSAGRVVTVR